MSDKPIRVSEKAKAILDKAKERYGEKLSYSDTIIALSKDKSGLNVSAKVAKTLREQAKLSLFDEDSYLRMILETYKSDVKDERRK